MQPDLIGLEISKGELRRLTGFDPDDVFRPSIFKDKKKRLSFLANEGVVAVALTPIIVGFIYAFLILPRIGSSILLGLILLILVPVGVILGRWMWRKFTCPQALTMLLDEVDRYHTIVKAVDINDELTAVGNVQLANDRIKVVEALKLIREDLVRALKTERVLRDNKNLLANNQELLTNNLANLQALQVNNQASEYARLLNQSLQIAVDVQAELKKIQSN
ncbi:hypothetical protein [Calothrix sp. PCC 6303]|uniref:hypothetical protein n=1 Tax=Calothrix sp. PCC 6303 TaxID=1170562 RepID=UPI0002A01373|nr:hypothetical protein [Calothrix sp. PCC 6303]AFZ02778.1 hypothetical protein Cal6303_3861 [Calothrix sp. PCC 6303]